MPYKICWLILKKSGNNDKQLCLQPQGQKPEERKYLSNEDQEKKQYLFPLK